MTDDNFERVVSRWSRLLHCLTGVEQGRKTNGDLQCSPRYSGSLANFFLSVSIMGERPVRHGRAAIHESGASLQSQKRQGTRSCRPASFARACRRGDRIRLALPILALSGHRDSVLSRPLLREERTSKAKAPGLLLTQLGRPTGSVIFYGPQSRMIRSNIPKRSEAVCATAQPGPTR
jgi:hypothetical protein